MFESIGCKSISFHVDIFSDIRGRFFFSLFCKIITFYLVSPIVGAQEPVPSFHSVSSSPQHPSRYTFLGPDSDGYTYKLLHLALSKTVKDNGEFTLEISPPMNEARALKSIMSKYYEKPIRRFESTPETLQNPMLQMVPFPVYLGVFSYRACVINTSVSASFGKATSIEMLKPFSFGVVEGWRDGDILRKNNLNVRPSVSKKSVYQLVNSGRVDTFCRAVTELPWEASYLEGLENVAINQNIILYYLMPFFFSTHVDDADLAKRIYVGLTEAFADGSLISLWSEYHDLNLVKQSLHNRQIITLGSLLSDDLAKNIEPYIIDANKMPRNEKESAQSDSE